MSKKTIEAIHEAIQAHVSDVDEDGEMLIDWVISYATIDHEDVFGVSYVTPAASTPHASVGLMQMGSQIINDDVSGRGTFEDD